MNVPRQVLDDIDAAVREGRVTEHGRPAPAPSQNGVPSQAADAGPGKATSEKKWMWRVVNHAHDRGWKVFHPYDGRRSAPGWPDLVLVRERVVYVELKAEKGRLTAAQAEWLAALMRAGAECHVFRPSQWAEVVEVLA